MLKRYLSVLTIFSMIFMLPACSDNESDDPKVVALQITSDKDTVPAGLTARLHAIAYLDDGSTESTSRFGTVVWQSQNEQVATVESNGVVTGKTPGQTIISATLGDISEEVTAIITDAELDSITIDDPLNAATPIGRGRQFSATGHYSDGSTHNITNEAGIEWKSSAPNIASIDAATGYSQALKKGSTAITATKDGVTSFPGATLTVTDAVIVNITISPNELTKPLGVWGKFEATAYFSDNTQQDVTNEVHWISDNREVVEIFNNGQVYSLAVGESQISATLDDTISSDNQPIFTVTHPQLNSFNVKGPSSQPLGKSVQFRAIAGFTDDQEYDVSGEKQVFWQSSNTDVATVTVSGVVKGVSEGEATISAFTAFSDAQSKKTITISPKEIDSVYIRSLSENLILSYESEQLFDAIGRYTNGTIEEDIERSHNFSWEIINNDQLYPSFLGSVSYAPKIGIGSVSGTAKYLTHSTIPGTSTITAQYKEKNQVLLSNAFDILLALPEKISVNNSDFIGSLSITEARILKSDYSDIATQELIQIEDTFPYQFVLMTHSQARSHCENLIYDNRNDWRLPESNELIALWNNQDGTDDANNFDRGWLFSHNYWSNTRSGSQFKSVSLSSGSEVDTATDESLFVSCVRDL